MSFSPIKFQPDSCLLPIFIAKCADPAADTAALEAEIDQLVYDLCGLTAEEFRMVEGPG